MRDFNGDGVVWGSGARDKVRVMLLVRCMGSIGLWLELWCRINVRVRARLRFSGVMCYGGH